MLRQFTTPLTFETRGRALPDITRPVVDWPVLERQPLFRPTQPIENYVSHDNR